MYYETENYLAHHGIKGQKWGIRRYQNADGTLTDEGRKRAGLKPESKREKRRAEAEKKRAEKQAAKDFSNKENLKNYLRKHPKQLYRHAGELTRDDAEEIIKNIEFDRRLKDIRDQEIKRGWNKVRQISDNLSTVNNLLNYSKGIYNSTAEINNMLISAGKLNGKPMAKIGQGGGNQNENKDKKE